MPIPLRTAEIVGAGIRANACSTAGSNGSSEGPPAIVLLGALLLVLSRIVVATADDVEPLLAREQADMLAVATPRDDAPPRARADSLQCRC